MKIILHLSPKMVFIGYTSIILIVQFNISAFYLMYRNIAGSIFNNPVESIMALFMMSLGEFGDFYESFSETRFMTVAIVRKSDSNCC